MLVLWLLFLGEIAITSTTSHKIGQQGHRALLQQSTGSSTKNSVAAGSQRNGAPQGSDPPGLIFNVQSRGGAKKVLDSLGASKVKQILKNSKQKGGRAELEKLLDRDPELVSNYRATYYVSLQRLSMLNLQQKALHRQL